MDAPSEVAEWLARTAGEAEIAARVVARSALEASRVRSLVARAIEWRIAAVLIERAPPAERGDFAE
jgi:hypothetical protein